MITIKNGRSVGQAKINQFGKRKDFSLFLVSTMTTFREPLLAIQKKFEERREKK